MNTTLASDEITFSPEEIFDALRSPCFVYCVRASEYSSHLKIGISDNPTKRLKQLDSTTHPLSYYLSHIKKFKNKEEAFKFEQEMLKEFHHLRGKGEWLSVDDSLAGYIDKNLERYTDCTLLELSDSHRANLARDIIELSDEYLKELSMISPARIKSSDRKAILSQFFCIIFIKNLILDSVSDWNVFCYLLKSFERAESAQGVIANVVGNNKPRRLAFLTGLGQDRAFLDLCTSYTSRSTILLSDGSCLERSNELDELNFINLMTKAVEGELSLNRFDPGSYNNIKMSELVWSFAAPDRYPYLWRKP